jgi:uracil-DNA glycosylase
VFTGERADEWLSALSSERLEGVFNPWGQANGLDREGEGPRRRVERLRAHFEAPEVELVLVAEAPGYQGAKWSGIAMTSERLLFEGVIPRLESQSQRRISERERPFSEPTATVVWDTLYKLGIAEKTLLWNAFPWHPCKESGLTNRPPRKDELDLGLPFLEDLASMFQGARIVAVGNHAAQSLSRLGLEVEKVRHPSMGGAGEFRSQMRSLVTGTVANA